jgi:outer membrane immunogenic protein
MKRIAAFFAAATVALPAHAADIYGSAKDGPAAYAPALSWTGFYVGAHAGYGWGDAVTRDRVEDWGTDPKYVGPFNYDPEGALIGATAGYNQQIGIAVFGVEADVGHMTLDGAGYIPSSNPLYHQDLTISDGLYGVLGGRVGIALGQVLLYGKGGWAYFDGTSSQKTTKPGFVTNETDGFSGWAYGGGVEVMLSQNLSLKAEYLRLDFGSEGGNQTSVTDAPIGHVYEYETDLTVDTAKIGLNYHF